MLFYVSMLNSNKAILCYPYSKKTEVDKLEVFSDKFITNKIYDIYINISLDSKEDFENEIYRFVDNIY
jgi:hypothetical protein